MRRSWLVGLLIISSLCATAPRVYAEGEAVNGFPNWSERVLLEWMNRARSDPQTDLAGCPSGDCLENSSGCYTPQAPRYLDYTLDYSSRFHADHLLINNYFDHPSHCTLVNNIDTLYPATCSGAASCSCTQGALTTDTTTWTGPGTRMGLFGAYAGAWGEIIAGGYDGPDATFYAWLYEQAYSSQCTDASNPNYPYNGNGHRWLLLTNNGGPSAGGGYLVNDGSYAGIYSSYAVMDFAGHANDTYDIPSGSHYPQQAASVDAWVNWYASAGPSVAKIDVDGVCSNMSLSRGTVTNGAWHLTVDSVGSGCHRYFFAFKDSNGNDVLYPTTGSLAIGDGSAQCPDWSSTAPAGCAGFDRIFANGFEP